jgi:hypothetical protein
MLQGRLLVPVTASGTGSARDRLGCLADTGTKEELDCWLCYRVRSTTFEEMFCDYTTASTDEANPIARRWIQA